MCDDEAELMDGDIDRQHPVNRYDHATPHGMSDRPQHPHLKDGYGLGFYLTADQEERRRQILKGWQPVKQRRYDKRRKK